MNNESDAYDEITDEKKTESQCNNNEECRKEETEDKAALAVSFIRDKSIDGLLTNAEDLIDEPLLLEVDEILPLIDEIKTREEFSDICISRGKEKIYLYSRKHITDKYADMMILVEEKDLFKTIAKTVREESKLYPRPTDVRLFNKTPFKFTKEEFDEVYEQLKKNEEYKDIKETRASNNALYLYSDLYMKKALADSLAEWIEVESEQNP